MGIGRIYKISIDEENNAEEYWTPRAQSLWETIICVKNDGFNLYFETREKAEAALKKFKRLPNWSLASYPEHAPHPLIDEVFVIELKPENFRLPPIEKQTALSRVERFLQSLFKQKKPVQ